jgi:hypothetical protein
MNSQELRVELANQGNRLNHIKAETQRLDKEWKESKKLETMLEGTMQTLEYLLKTTLASEAKGLKEEEALVGGNVTPISAAQG